MVTEERAVTAAGVTQWRWRVDQGSPSAIRPNSGGDDSKGRVDIWRQEDRTQLYSPACKLILM